MLLIAREKQYEVNVNQRRGYVKQMDMIQNEYLHQDEENHQADTVNKIYVHICLFLFQRILGCTEDVNPLLHLCIVNHADITKFCEVC